MARVEVNAYTDLFRRLHETLVYKTLAGHLHHAVRSLYSAFLKAAEAAAGMALPGDVHMRIEG